MNETEAVVGGPSFPPALKMLASLLMLALVAGFALAFDELPLADMPTGGQLFLAAAGLLVAAGYLSILFSRTAMSDTHLREGWLLHNEVALADIVQVKWLRLRWLDAIVVPRLVVRVKGRGNVTFHIADPELRERVDYLVHLGPPTGPA